MRILLVEDDPLLADGLARALKQSAYVIEQASDGKAADQWLKTEEFDLVILDLGLPEIDGSEVLRRLRQRKQHTPVLILSARMALEERVRLLNLGADDYVLKPVALAELEARVRALIRRGQSIQDTLITLGKLQLDTLGKRALLEGKALDLTAREWVALEFLAKRVNRIISKEQISQVLYSWEEETSPNAIEKFISRLRSKLEPADICIQTVRGLGYFLEKPADSP